MGADARRARRDHDQLHRPGRPGGHPGAARAAGAACAANLIAPVIPCHRVLRTDGSLGGYYYGLERKQWLLSTRGGVSAPAPALGLPARASRSPRG